MIAVEAILPPLVLTVLTVALLPLLLLNPICLPPRSPSSCRSSVSSDVRAPSLPPDTCGSANTSEMWVDVGLRPEGVRSERGALRREEGFERLDRGVGAEDMAFLPKTCDSSTR